MGATCCSATSPEERLRSEGSGQEPSTAQADSSAVGGSEELPRVAVGVHEDQSGSGLSSGSKPGKKAVGQSKANVAAEGRSNLASVAAGAKKESENVEQTVLRELHFLVRWGKPVEELLQAISKYGVALSAVLAARDVKTGNQALHIAAQNGNRKLVSFLLKQGAEVNSSNLKGNTPLHMAVEYDLYFISKHLMDNSADPKIKNCDGHPALHGISGDKVGKAAWDNPLAVLSSISDNAVEVSFALNSLEKMDPKDVDKAMLVRIGLRKRKECPVHWDRVRFKNFLDRLE